MQYRVYDRVKLVKMTEGFEAAGVKLGATGCIVDDFEDGAYEIELWDEKENPYARIVVTAEHIELTKRF